jgi:hypothetical protein
MDDFDAFDATLTTEERAAPTFMEWRDASLARGVRVLAAKLHDSVGFDGITGMAAALALERVARESNAEKYDITLDGGTRITVRLQNTEGHAAVLHADVRGLSSDQAKRSVTAPREA